MSDALTRLDELLADRATQGLSAEEARELDELLAAAGLEADEALDYTAAAVARSAAPAQAMPEALRQRVLADAATALPASGASPSAADPAAAAAQPMATDRPARRSPVIAFIGGALTAAAIWLVFVGLSPRTADTAPTPDQLLAAADTLNPSWSVFHKGYDAVAGDVVWNNDRQAGYLRLTGLPANDPQRAQYQLWIVDPQRDAEPVDGGVFDVPPGKATVVIPIDPKLRVIQPTAFAITLEQPGGVVKSEGPLLVTAVVDRGA